MIISALLFSETNKNIFYYIIEFLYERARQSSKNHICVDWRVNNCTFQISLLHFIRIFFWSLSHTSSVPIEGNSFK